MSAMTLEQVVRVIDDEIAALPTMAAMAASGIPTSCDPRPAIERLSAARDAIEAIRARGEPVAEMGEGGLVWFKQFSPQRNAGTKFYTQPPAPKVTDAMVERACKANLHPLAEPSDTERRHMRAALEAALKDQP